MEQTVINLKHTKRRRVAVWTPWGHVPAEEARQKWRSKSTAGNGSGDDRGPTEGLSKPRRRLAS